MFVDALYRATLDPRLQLPPELAHVQAYLHSFDADLRLRKSAEREGYFVLERRCRRAPAVNTGMRNASDIHVQARDGYIHISLVHLQWLFHPWNIIRELREAGVDLWAAGGAAEAIDELEYEERFLRETRRRRTREDYRANLRESFDILNRLGNRDGTERTRYNNPGLPAAATGEAA
jgi:hypothetical protein